MPVPGDPAEDLAAAEDPAEDRAIAAPAQESPSKQAEVDEANDARAEVDVAPLPRRRQSLLAMLFCARRPLPADLDERMMDEGGA